MGIKSMSLQMIPWCFHLMTNHFSCVHLKSSSSSSSDHHHQVRTIKLIKSDGLVKIYHRPVTVSELMNEFPKHLVCHSDSFYIGQKIPPLSETEKLQLGHNYFLLPKHFFQSVLSFVTIASFATSTNSSKSSPPVRAPRNAFLKNAFVIKKTASGSLQICVSDEFISSLIQESKMKDCADGIDEQEEEDPRNRICSTAQLQKEYTQLVVLSKQWKPKLETIKESKKQRLASFGIKRRKKPQAKRITEQHKFRNSVSSSSNKSSKKKGL